MEIEKVIALVVLLLGITALIMIFMFTIGKKMKKTGISVKKKKRYEHSNLFDESVETPFTNQPETVTELLDEDFFQLERIPESEEKDDHLEEKKRINTSEIKSECEIQPISKNAKKTVVTRGWEKLFEAEPERVGESEPENERVHINEKYNHVDLDGDYSSHVFIGCELVECKFIEQKLKKILFHNCKIINSSFMGSDLSDAVISNTLIKKTSFKYAELKNAVVTSTTFDKTTFESTDLSGVTMTDIKFKFCTVSENTKRNEIILSRIIAEDSDISLLENNGGLEK